MEQSSNEPSEHITMTPSGVIDQQRRKPVQIGVQDDIYSAAFLADGKYIVSGHEDGKIRQWRVEDGAEVGTPMDEGAAVFSLAVSRDGKWVVDGRLGGKVTVWDAESRERVRAFMAHTGNDVNVMDVSPDGERIATGSDDKTVCVWSLLTGQRLLGPWKHSEDVGGVKFSPDGQLIATATWRHESIRIYSNQTGDLLVDLPIQPCSQLNKSLAWTSDGRRLFVLSYDGNVHCLDASTGGRRCQWPIHSSREPSCIVLAKNDRFIATWANSSVSFWDTVTHEQVGPVIQHSGESWPMDMSRNYDLLTCTGQMIAVHNLRDFLSPSYCDDVHPGPVVQHVKKLEEVVKSLHTQERSANIRIASLEETVQQLTNQLSDTQCRAGSQISHLEQQLHDSQCRADSFVQIVCAHERALQCEALYAKGRIRDAAILLIEVTDTISEDLKANNLMMNWLARFTNQCIFALEKTGDDALDSENQDGAISAYSTALSLSSSGGNTLLKWVRMLLTRSSPDEALSAAAKFKSPRSAIYQAICSILERLDRISEAVECFQKWQTEETEHALSPGTVDEPWVTDFKRRCVKMLEQRGDSAMDSASFSDAIAYYTTALTLDPSSVDLLTKRSKARVASKSWELALEDADAAIEVAPLSSCGYERRRAALLGARRFDEAIRAYEDMLSVLEQSSDPAARELRKTYVSPSQTISAVRASTKRAHRDAPLVLIDTETGCLCRQQARTDAFESDPKFKELVASIMMKHENSRIERTVQEYFQYATFSHTWEGAEPLYLDVLGKSVRELEQTPTTYKLMMFCLTAQEAGLRWAWSDTCCINKVDHSELQESLTSMFKWYHDSALTIIHLKDVSSDSNLVSLENCFWNARAWTLQEFFASRVIRFYTKDWKRYRSPTNTDNDKDSEGIMAEMGTANGVGPDVLLSLQPGSENVRQKLCLAAKRIATKQEDLAYSLFGIFDVSIPHSYGEGQEQALGRLLQEVLTRSGDATILAWSGQPSKYNSCLPADIDVYRTSESSHIPSLIPDDKMDALVAELRSSSYLNSALALYERLALLAAPRPFSHRLSISCLMFPLKGRPLKAHSPGVYHVMTSAFGNVEIRTSKDLSGLQNLALVHPWFKSLLDPAIPFKDPSVGEDDVPLSPVDKDTVPGNSDSLSPSSDTALPSHDDLTMALRLFTRLRQPFGALLFSAVSHNEFKRIASDRPIVAQLQSNVSPRYLMDKVRTVDVL